jgi:hypothetical protein
MASIPGKSSQGALTKTYRWSNYQLLTNNPTGDGYFKRCKHLTVTHAPAKAGFEGQLS